LSLQTDDQYDATEDPMTLITSPHNTKLKELRKLQRARERARRGLFVAEGEDLVRAAHDAGRPAVEGFRMAGVERGAANQAANQAASASRADRTADATEAAFHEVEPGALAAVSTLGSGARVIGVYEQRWGAPSGPLCVYLHGIGDPGNVGTVLRGALAFGACSVALGPGCADPHSPKAVRASMGAIFWVALARVRDVGELPGERIALVARAGAPLSEVVESIGPRVSAHGEALGDGPPAAERHKHALTLLVGAEREGLPVDVVAACERVAHIPIASDSLNAAMAATVALYELTRASTRVSAS
jgi:TrmH family RNA methyltransferase